MRWVLTILKHFLVCDVNASLDISDTCVCNPGFAGNGLKCGNDADGNGLPDKPLNCPEKSCYQDNCLIFPNCGQEDADGDG